MNVLEKFKLNNQLAVVTGAFGNLANVWISSLLEAGARVAAIELPGKTMPKHLSELEKKYTHNNLKFYYADIRDKVRLKEIKSLINSEMGMIDILVNNAGIDQPPGKVKTYKINDIPVNDFEKVISVNINGTFYACQVFSEDMLTNKKGSIINIGSLYASVSPDYKLYQHLDTEPPFLKPPAYGASKAAIINLTKYLAAHWGKDGIRVNSLSPGGVDGNQDEEFKKKYISKVAAGRMARAGDLSGPLIFLASDASSYVNGIDLLIDGGFLTI